LGIAVVGGLAFSQIVTLYVTPVFYSYFDQMQAWLGRRAAKAVSLEPAAVPVSGD
jgi:HAE1 family hydrophobic/amphiphilic exporter-1